MKLKFVEKKDEAQGIKSFFFEPEKKVIYLAGQFYYFTLPKLNYPDPRGATRHFTLSSSPTEGDRLRITTRVRQESGYKKTLDELAPGDMIDGEGPSGTFVLNESDKSQQVFLAGGIGITPFRSIIKYAADKNLGIPMHLIYANSTVEQITFRNELTDLAKSHSDFLKVDMTISKPEESKESWTGLTGRVDENLIKKLTSSYTKPIFWLCGPPPMVDALETTLSKMGIPSGQIRLEKFTGY